MAWPTPEAKYDVVALGEAMVEFNQTQAGQALYLQGFGGDTSNALIAASRAGARTAYLSRIGEDWSGQRLQELWRSEGINTSGVSVADDAPTGLYFVTHGPQGHEFGYQRKGSAASRMSPQWLDSRPGSLIERARILHVSGISMAISESACETVFAAMQRARAGGVRVSLDTNLRLKLWPLERARQTLARAAALCNYFLPSLEDALPLAGLTGDARPHDLADWAHALGAPLVVVKLGADGCLLSLRGQSAAERVLVPGHRVAVVDATGAGDCFCGNFLARLAAGDPAAVAARWANAAAALAVQGFGAVAPLPPAQAVTRFLAGARSL